MGNIDINYYDIEELDILHINTLEDGFSEAEEKLELHLKRERDPRAVAAAKNLFKLKHNGKLFCEICNFDFGKTYGEIGDGYIEAHHKKPISKMNPGDITKIEDFLMVCSNCHSMLHRGKEWIPHEELKNKLNKKVE